MATKLTDAKLKALPTPAAGQVEHSDTDVPGLRARIGKSGAITFILRKRVAGRVRNLTLGRFGPRFGIVEARRKARSLLSDVEAGKGLPAPAPRSEIGALTFRVMLPQYLASKADLRSHAEVKRILEGYVLPDFGDRLTDTVTRGDVTRLVDGIAKRAPTMARAVHAQLSAFYSWALPRLDRMEAIHAEMPVGRRRRRRATASFQIASWRRYGALRTRSPRPGGQGSSCSS